MKPGIRAGIRRWLAWGSIAADPKPWNTSDLDNLAFWARRKGVDAPRVIEESMGTRYSKREALLLAMRGVW